jgi:hypothetical protein
MQMAEAISEAVHPPDVQRRLKEVRPQVAEQLASMQAQMQANNRAAVLEKALSSGEAPSERYTRAKAAAARFIEAMNQSPAANGETIVPR